MILGIDLGLRTGLALVDEAGRLVWFRSTRFPDRARMKKGVHRLISELPQVDGAVAEGDPRLARVWARELERVQGIVLQVVAAEAWRPALFKPSERRDGSTAKLAAERLAWRLVDEGGLSRPRSMTDDVAEAICIAWWAHLEGRAG